MASRSALPAEEAVIVPTRARARQQLVRAAQAWFAATALGQALFALFILLFYYPSTLTGDYAAWNEKPLIDGYTPGDGAGNLQFAAHVLMASAMTVAGLVQLLPQIRARWPLLHRWSGRIFLTLAFLLSLGGLWLVWVRGTYLTLAGGIAVSLDGLLILACGTLAWRAALSRDFVSHRRWALRTFAVASGVWFMRVGYMVWGILTGGAGIGPAMSGPFDHFWAFATHLIPLATVELYLRAERAGPNAQRGMAALLWVAALLILGGSAAAWAMMWWPPIAALHS
ncbi:MAG: DUF2306 domain-containing protein [Erythrobacter sp.]